MATIAKYRPSLTAKDIDTIVSALLTFEPASQAYKTMKLFQMKLDMEAVKPTHVTMGVKEAYEQNAPLIESPQDKEAKEQIELAELQKKLMKEFGPKTGNSTVSVVSPISSLDPAEL